MTAPKINLGEFEEFVEGNGYRDLQIMPDGRYACVMPLLFTHAIIIGDIRGVGPDDRWCYSSLEKAQTALLYWKEDFNFEGEPQGWHRHPATGRRRENGDPATETINL
jgi:hypothetical protein